MARKMRDSGVEWIGEVPEGWEIDKTRRCFRQTNTRGNSSLVLLAATQKYGMYPQDRLEGVVKVKEDTDLQLFRTVHIDDFVISLRSFQGGFAHSKFEGVCSPAYQTFHAVRSVEPSYYSYLFKSDLFIQKINSLTVGIREGKNINYRDFSETLIPIPPLPEQRRIADYLDEKCAAIDGAVGELKRGIEDCKAWKKAIIFEAVTGKANVLAAKNAKVAKRQMRDSGIPWIGEIPEGWGMLKASKTFSIITDFVASGSFADLRENVKYLDQPDYAQLVRTADVSGKSHEIRPVYISKESYNFLAGSNLFGGELLLPNIGASVGDVYIVPVIYERMSLAPNAIMAKGSMCDKFYFYYFSCEAGRLSLEDIAESTAQPKFNKTDFRNLRLPAPPLTEQQAIADYLDEKCAAIDTLVAEKEKLIADLEAYKKSLIFELVTGKREVA